jgi:hypothetical protein
MNPSFEPSFEQTLVGVWRQTLVENADVVELGTERYPVWRTPKRRLWEVDFVLNGNTIGGLKHIPDRKSRWAEMAPGGKGATHRTFRKSCSIGFAGRTIRLESCQNFSGMSKEIRRYTNTKMLIASSTKLPAIFASLPT